MILKLMFDVAELLVIVVLINQLNTAIEHWNKEVKIMIGTWFDLTVDLCFRFSMTCITALEVCCYCLAVLYYTDARNSS